MVVPCRHCNYLPSIACEQQATAQWAAQLRDVASSTSLRVTEATFVVETSHLIALVGGEVVNRL